MGENKAKIFLAIIVSNWIIVQIIDSTANINDENTAMSLWDESRNDASRTHIYICCSIHEGFLNLKRNETGHVVSKTGVSIAMMDWLSDFVKFEYECLPMLPPVSFMVRENDTNTIDYNSLSLVKRGVCLMAPQAFVMTYARFKYYCDFPSPFVYTPFGLLIPVPQKVAKGGLSSVWRPFQDLVWTALLVSIAITMLLSVANWLFSRNRLANVDDRNELRLELHWLFIFGLLMSKAGYSAPESFKMRLAGGAWCLAALLLTNYYSSILTSLITASIPVPIVNSIEELANKDNVKLIVAKGWSAAKLITGDLDASNTPLLKKLNIKLKSENSICFNISECFRKLTEEKTTTFLHDKQLALALLSEDYRRTGRCNAALAQETYGMMYLAWGISRNYSNFEMLQRGILLMMATGLVDHWADVYVPSPTQCLVDPNSLQAIMADIRNPALVDLPGLVPAFMFLLFGCILSAIVLVAEWINKLKLWQFFPIFRSLPSI